MEKPDYHKFIEEARTYAAQEMRYPINLIVRIVLFLLCVFLLAYIFKYLSLRNYEPGNIKYILSLIFSFFIILIYAVGLVPLKLNPSKSQVAVALKYLLSVKENEYLEDQNDSTDYLNNLLDDLELARNELEVAQDNLLNDNKSYKKNVEESVLFLNRIRDNITIAEGELKSSKENLKEFSAVKKALEMIWI